MGIGMGRCLLTPLDSASRRGARCARCGAFCSPGSRSALGRAKRASCASASQGSHGARGARCLRVRLRDHRSRPERGEVPAFCSGGTPSSSTSCSGTSCSPSSRGAPSARASPVACCSSVACCSPGHASHRGAEAPLAAARTAAGWVLVERATVLPHPGAAQQAAGADGPGSLASLGSPARGTAASRWAAERSAKTGRRERPS
jgi:hypothetical protein